MKATIKSAQIPIFSLVLYLLIVFTTNGFAGSATWKASPATGDWNTATNWVQGTVPNGPNDVATFATSNKTAVSVSAQTEVNEITFNPGASAFTITVPLICCDFGLNISGVGIANDSGTTQNIVATNGTIQFSNTATAGSSTSYTLNQGFIEFFNTSTAGNATFTVNKGAEIDFDTSTSAGSATFTLNSGLVFFGGTAGNATFTINGETAASTGVSFVTFNLNSSAGAATFIANPGSNGGHGGGLGFFRHSIGGTSRVELFGNGTGDFTDGFLEIYFHHAGHVSIGSLEGTGSVFLGSRRLIVGSNDLSTTFSGVITDCTASDPTCRFSGGSLRKIGKGTLTLSRSSGNTYTGGTTIDKGTLIATNNTGSATGSGAVQVNSGTLSGTGIINGALTVGNGTRTGAILQPGVGTTAGTLTINNTVTFNPPSGFKCNVNRATTPLAAKLKALGVTIGANVTFKLVETGTTTLTPGTVFTVINNTSANPISGTFSNLPDGGTITSANGTVYKANYEGGTGNDLTLMVQ